MATREEAVVEARSQLVPRDGVGYVLAQPPGDHSRDGVT